MIRGGEMVYAIGFSETETFPEIERFSKNINADDDRLYDKSTRDCLKSEGASDAEEIEFRKFDEAACILDQIEFEFMYYDLKIDVDADVEGRLFFAIPYMLRVIEFAKNKRKINSLKLVAGFSERDINLMNSILNSKTRLLYWKLFHVLKAKIAKLDEFVEYRFKIEGV